MKKNCILGILLFLMLNSAGNIQSSQAEKLTRIIEVVQGLSKVSGSNQKNVNQVTRTHDEYAASWALPAESVINVRLDNSGASQLPLKPKLSAEEKKYLKNTNAINVRIPENCAIEVVSIPVLNQGDHSWPTGRITSGLSWETVAQGEGGNCGYHALKNVQGLIEILQEPRFLTKDDAEFTLSSLASFEMYQEFMKVNALKIDARFRKGSDLSWLGGGELEYLLQDFPSNQKNKIVIIEHVQQEGLEFSDDVLNSIKAFAQSPADLLGIVWNSGRRIDLRNMGGSHWVGFVAVKIVHAQGCNIKLYVMDSGSGGGGAYVERVKQLLSLSSQQIDEMIERSRIGHMQADIETLSNPYRQDPTTLKDVVNLILINWKDYKIPLSLQLQVLDQLMFFWQQEITLDTDKNYLCANMVRLGEKLNLVNTDELRVLCLSMQ